MQDFEIGGISVPPGKSAQIDLPVVRLYTDSDVSMPVHIIRGKEKGPCVFVCAAIHGDELNGIEIVRRLIRHKSFKITHGTLLLVPMVNVYGVLNQSRYMPDRRDLNRAFPGSAKGTLAGIVANKFMKEIVEKCDYGIDLHTGAVHRSNLPQIRANLNDRKTARLARAFGVPVLLNAEERDGSLRQAAVDHGARILLYEAGEALRFDELSIRAGTRGIRNVLSQLGMTGPKEQKNNFKPFVANTSNWVRASASGIVNNLKNLGDFVQEGDSLARIGSPLGELFGTVKARRSGIIIGRQNIPLVQQGEAMFHIAYFTADEQEIADNITLMQDTYIPKNLDLFDNKKTETSSA